MRPRDGAGAHVLPGSPPGDRERGARRVAEPHPAPQDPSLTHGFEPAILVIAGPTGTGKSALALRVAEILGGEIVGCDALQVYRGFDAATAKPSRRERERVPHWLIDVADPREPYTLAAYVRDAGTAIAAITASGRVPIVAGGTGMYLRGLLKGIVPAPLPDRALRLRLQGLLLRRGSARLHRLLRTIDPRSADRLPPGDTQRVVRALELAFAGGATWSARLDRSGTWAAGPERYRALKLALDVDRDLLAARLAARVDAFFAAGLPEEVERLLADGVPETANAFQGIGYREILEARAEGRDAVTAREAIVAATRRLAKRQRTWLRSEPALTWLDGAQEVEALAAEVVRRWQLERARDGAMPAC